jgi:hypothetical protein
MSLVEGAKYWLVKSPSIALALTSTTTWPAHFAHVPVIKCYIVCTSLCGMVAICPSVSFRGSTIFSMIVGFYNQKKLSEKM